MEKQTQTKAEAQGNVRFTGKIAEKIRQLAEDDDRFISYVVKRLVRERLEQMGEV